MLTAPSKVCAIMVFIPIVSSCLSQTSNDLSPRCVEVTKIPQVAIEAQQLFSAPPVIAFPIIVSWRLIHPPCSPSAFLLRRSPNVSPFSSQHPDDTTHHRHVWITPIKALTWLWI
jgi:hypothetical protein